VIELERHIEILLLSNDCVIVPELGGFMAHHTEARYDEHDNMFLPPLRTLGFNPQLKLNDSLLAQSYIEAYDISYPEAILRIEDEVNELKQCLYNEGSYELNDIGTLYLNEDGHYAFEPCEAGILTPNLYGLSCFEMEKMTNEQVITEEKTSLAKEETSLPTVNRIFNKPAVATRKHEDRKIICLRESTLRKAAAIFIGILVIVSFAIPIGNHKQGNLLQSKIDTGILYNMMPKNITTGKIPVKPLSKKADNIEATKEKAPAQTSPVSSKTVATTEFCIVLASKVSTRNAELYVNTLKEAGHSSARIYTKNKTNRVVYGHYPTESAAYNALNQLNSNPDFAEGWVMKITQN